MTEIYLPSDRLAQAIYTWSLTNVDGSQGMGFTTISPALKGSIDWLQRFRPTAFHLFRENATGVASDPYEARRGFSEIGRLFERGVGVVYCKTADGTVNAKSRPQVVVHALIGDAHVLRLGLIGQIPENFWIRKIDDVERSKSELNDIAASALPAAADASEHFCPNDHAGARAILQAIANIGRPQEVQLECPSSNRIIPEILLAIPSTLVKTASLTPYVSLAGVVKQLHLTAPDTSRSDPSFSGSVVVPGGCEFVQAVESAARKYLDVKSPDLTKFASAALQATSPRPGGSGSIKRKDHPDNGKHETAVTSGRSQSAVTREIASSKRESDFAYLSEKQGLQVAERLRVHGLPVVSILEEPDEILLELFRCVQSYDTLRSWFLLFQDVPLDTFVALWNRTHIAAFLGFILMRLRSSNESLKEPLVASSGVESRVTASILRTMSQHPGGGEGIAAIIDKGLGSSEVMREFICNTFNDDAAFLYDGILEKLQAHPLTRLDYIRFGYSEWVRYRGLPESEAAAIDQVLRPGLLTRFRILIGRLSPTLGFTPQQ